MATDRKTVFTFDGDGVQTIFAFPCDYLRKTFMMGKVGGTILSYSTDYTVTDKQMEFVVAPPVGTGNVVIYRETTTDRLVAWADASVLRASDMTLFEVQMLHLAEETSDKVTTDATFEADRALLPPPPTPITFIAANWSKSISNSSMDTNSSLYIGLYQIFYFPNQ